MVRDWSKLRRRTAQALGALGGLSLAACSAQTPPAQVSAQAARPALWALSDEDTTIYMFGTFHLLPKDHVWRTAALDRALAEADELVLEVADVDDPNAMAQAMVPIATSPGLPPLVQRVPQEKRAALSAMIKESGIPMAALDQLETWAAGLMLLGVTFGRLGLDPSAGVEKGLTDSYKASGRPVRGLETAAEQLGFFDKLSEESQRAFLVSSLEAPEETRKQFAEMLTAWSTGDVEGVARTFDDETLMSPELRDALMTKRNAKWADWLERRLEQPGTILVAVGAGHLAGRDSVQEMLKAKGLKTRRLQ